MKEKKETTQIHGRGRLGSGGSFSGGNVDLGYASINGAQAIGASNESEQTWEVFGGQ